ncbi:hypothetical protein [Bacillus sp. MMSF_3328]|uniref:hypothetical protein n=1 Tax=Bacillus sp. MMSF_3328 TaxID=3047080 RepID=UPI00273D7658|nr:hypothetical protein [Bacillus sp. MMSF_3328]
MEFKEFLIHKYNIGDKSAKDYVGRFNGIVNKGIYRGEKEITPALIKAVEKEFPNSKNHYRLALERYIEYLKEAKRNTDKS